MTATKQVALEQVILVDEQNNSIGLADKLSAHQKNQLHRAFSIFIFRKNPESNRNELLLQQRALHKYHSAGLWTNTCCSHPRPNETILTAGARRLKEELGIEAILQELDWFHYNVQFANGLTENEIDHVLIGFIDAKIAIHPNPEEVHSFRWVTFDQLENELIKTPEKFTVWFEKALKIAKKTFINFNY